MYSNRSTDNLLDNLEKELNEVIELDNPVRINTLAEVEIEHEKIEKPKNVKISKPPPVPAKRILVEPTDPSSSGKPPTVTTRKIPLRDKQVKNNENEIIQLSSVSSNTPSEEQKSGKTILRKNSEKKVVETTRTEAETVFIETITEKSLRTSKQQPREVEVEIVNEQKKPRKVSQSITTSSNESSSESLTSSSTSAKARRKKKKKRRTKSRQQSEINSTENLQKQHENEKIDRQEVAAVLHTCGPLKFNMNFKSGLRIRVSLYNEDTGKLIGETKLSKFGKFNKDFL